MVELKGRGRWGGACRALSALALAALLLGGPAGWPRTAVAGAAQQERCFAETGQCIGGRFLAYWQANGGLARHGYPLSQERRETLENGREYIVQYFERARFEYHPENAPPYDVLLGQFGRRILLERVGREVFLPVEPREGAVYFPETGQNVGPRFFQYWQANGGLAQFGLPLSEAFEEELEDGGVYLVQYFERARFELHPENAPPADVLLGQFGRRVLSEAGLLWLDRRALVNWNGAGLAIPAAPAPRGEPAAGSPRCARGDPNASPEDRAVAAAGWTIVRNVGTGANAGLRRGVVAVVPGMAAVDGMCRPLQFQYFVFLGGRFAGTLSPVTMDSRTDGALSEVTIAADGLTLAATYARYSPYSPRDAACCPSARTTVQFRVDRVDAGPLVIPVLAATEPIAAPARPAARRLPRGAIAAGD